MGSVSGDEFIDRSLKDAFLFSAVVVEIGHRLLIARNAEDAVLAKDTKVKESLEFFMTQACCSVHFHLVR